MEVATQFMSLKWYSKNHNFLYNLCLLLNCLPKQADCIHAGRNGDRRISLENTYHCVGLLEFA